MKVALILGGLVLLVLLAEKFEEKLFPPFSWAFAIWKKGAHLLGVVMSSILLTMLWIVGFGIYGIILKIITILKPSQTDDTYWITCEPHNTEQMQRQF